MFEFLKKEKEKTYKYTLSDESLSRFLENLISYAEIDGLSHDISYLRGVIETINNTERAGDALNRVVSACCLVEELHSWSINKEEVTDD